MLAHVRVIHGYLAIVAYDVTTCLYIHYGHYLNTVSIRKVVVVNIRILLQNLKLCFICV